MQELELRDNADMTKEGEILRFLKGLLAEWYSSRGSIVLPFLHFFFPIPSFSLSPSPSSFLLNLQKLSNTRQEELDQRSPEEKKTAYGKEKTATFRQTVDYIKPLFKQLRSKKISPDIGLALERMMG
jgi:hypothetical protein